VNLELKHVLSSEGVGTLKVEYKAFVNQGGARIENVVKPSEMGVTRVF
jgi:hypothetical protein